MTDGRDVPDWYAQKRAALFAHVEQPLQALQPGLDPQARVTLASAEEAIAEQVLRAAAIYGQSPVALQLRQMNLLYEMNKERGSTVLIPTDMAAALGKAFTAAAP